MPRARTILQSEFPYNICSRCINREWFTLPMDVVWNIFCEEITRTVKDKNLLVHSFVLMSNHYHMLASTPEANISECMQQMLSRISRRLTKEGNRINQTFAGRYYKSILRLPNHYLSVYKYNYLNPVTAGICSGVENYRYSTLHGLLGHSKLEIPLAEDSTLISDPRGTLIWLNTRPDQEKLEAVRYGLKRKYFQSKKSRVTNKLILGDDDIL